MTQHAELIDRLRNLGAWHEESRLTASAEWTREAADAIEALGRENAELRERLAATAKSAFEAMPHDIPTRMKRQICVNAGWSGSLASRAYIEIRNALTGEAYKADEDLDAARAEINGLRKKAARYDWLRDAGAWESEIVLDTLAPEEFDERVDAAIEARNAAIQHEGASDER